MNLFENVESKISKADQKVILEAVEQKAQQIAEERITKVEEEYAEKFSSLTESVTTTIVDVVEKSIDDNTKKLVKDHSVSYLMESIAKIQGILEDIGLKVNDSGTLDNRMQDAEEKLQRSAELVKKAKDIADKNVAKVNKLKVELFVRKSLAGIQDEVIESAVSYFADSDVDIDEIEDELALWMEKKGLEETNVIQSPGDTSLADAGIDEDALDKDLQELDEMMGKNLFENTDPKQVSKPSEDDTSVPKFEGLKGLKTRFGTMSDVSSSQLEAIDEDGAEYVQDYDSEIMSKDVNDAVNSIKKLNGGWSL